MLTNMMHVTFFWNFGRDKLKTLTVNYKVATVQLKEK